MFYFYWQKHGQDAWRLALEDDRAAIIESEKPRYVTALGLDVAIEKDTERESILKANYTGPLYIDIDVSPEDGGVAKAIEQTNKLLAKFSDAGVDTRCFELYLSGSKGTHIIIPFRMMVQKPNPRGYQNLPMIYKHMMTEFFVDHVDLVVYSAGRGRMFRCANVERENGKFKVPVTLVEMRVMTAEQYGELIQKPRTVALPDNPVYSSTLALSFAKAKDRTETMLKKAIKSSLSPAQVTAWQRSVPTELNCLLEGEGVSPDVGFQRIATQVAIAAVGLGWSESVMLEKARGLVAKHVSDSRRYDSEGKRVRELSRMFDYFTNNGAYYELALPPIKALLVSVEAEDGAESDETEELSPEEDMSMRLRISKFGIYKPHDDFGEVRASSMGMDNITSLRDPTNGSTAGFSVDIYADGKLKGNRMVTIDAFTSRNNLARFAAAECASPMTLTDQQSGAVMWMLNQLAERNGKVQYVLNREGLDVIEHPHATNPDHRLDLVYMSGETLYGCRKSRLNIDYTIRSVGNDSVTPKSDLFAAPALVADADTTQFFDNLFKINTPANLGKLLGWFVAAFFRQILHKKWQQFPLLQVYGQAGSGKTRTCELLARMHYHVKSVDVKQASGMSAHAIKSRLAGSASVPILLDDMRMNTMPKYEKFMMETFMLGSYNASNSENGTVRKDSGVSHLDVRTYRLGAPVVFMAETIMGEPRIIARSMVVPMRMSDRGSLAAWNHVYLNQTGILGRLGWQIINAIIPSDGRDTIQVITDKTAAFEAQVLERFGTKGTEANRQAFNVAVVLAGLDMLRAVLSSEEVGFGQRYTPIIQTLTEAVLDPSNEAIIKDMDETSRVVNTLAYLTKAEHPDTYRLLPGVDYTVDVHSIDLKLQNVFTKFLIYNRTIGVAPWISDYPRFLAAMRHYDPVIDKFCLSNALLKDAPRTDVFRLHKPLLDEIGIDNFRD